MALTKEGVQKVLEKARAAGCDIGGDAFGDDMAEVFQQLADPVFMARVREVTGVDIELTTNGVIVRKVGESSPELPAIAASDDELGVMCRGLTAADVVEDRLIAREEVESEIQELSAIADEVLTIEERTCFTQAIVLRHVLDMLGKDEIMEGEAATYIQARWQEINAALGFEALQRLN